MALEYLPPGELGLDPATDLPPQFSIRSRKYTSPFSESRPSGRRPWPAPGPQRGPFIGGLLDYRSEKGHDPN